MVRLASGVECNLDGLLVFPKGLVTCAVIVRSRPRHCTRARPSGANFVCITLILFIRSPESVMCKI